MSEDKIRHHARLKALLGPPGQEISCEECFERLDEFVEHELSGHDADHAVPGMRAHLEGCPACGEDYDSLKSFVLSERG